MCSAHKLSSCGCVTDVLTGDTAQEAETLMPTVEECILPQIKD